MSDSIMTTDLEARVLEYGPNFVVAFSRKGKFEFTGGIVHATREAAANRIPEEVDFMRRYWQSQLDKRDGAVVVEGAHYRIGDSRPSTRSSHRGFGGRLFMFQDLNTGEIIESDNVWMQGDIPDAFRKFFPDTHKRA